jgi:hypothetical protein
MCGTADENSSEVRGAKCGVDFQAPASLDIHVAQADRVSSSALSELVVFHRHVTPFSPYPAHVRTIVLLLPFALEYSDSIIWQRKIKKN